MSIHNLAFLLNLMRQMRAAIIGGTFEAFAVQFLSRYEKTVAQI